MRPTEYVHMTPVEIELHRELRQKQFTYWNQPCECGSGKVRANCRCRVELTERLFKSEGAR